MVKLYKRKLDGSGLEEVAFPSIVDILTDNTKRTAVMIGKDYRHAERFGINSVDEVGPIPLTKIYDERAFVDPSSNSVFFIKRKVIYQTENVFRLFYDLDKVNYENRYLLVEGTVNDVLKEFKRKRYTLLDKR